jgi:hypothetical protein
LTFPSEEDQMMEVEYFNDLRRKWVEEFDWMLSIVSWENIYDKIMYVGRAVFEQKYLVEMRERHETWEPLSTSLQDREKPRKFFINLTGYSALWLPTYYQPASGFQTSEP